MDESRPRVNIRLNWKCEGISFGQVLLADQTVREALSTLLDSFTGVQAEVGPRSKCRWPEFSTSTNSKVPQSAALTVTIEPEPGAEHLAVQMREAFVSDDPAGPAESEWRTIFNEDKLVEGNLYEGMRVPVRLGVVVRRDATDAYLDPEPASDTT